MSIFPVDVASLMERVVDLEKRVGLAAHRSIAEQRADDELTLRFRQTSHGITQLTASLGRTGVGSTVISRFMTGISAGPPQMLLRCQTLPSMWTLGKDKPVIPGVPFIR